MPPKKERERESSTEDTSSVALLPRFMTHKTAILSRCARFSYSLYRARALSHAHTHARRARREMLLFPSSKERKRKQKNSSIYHAYPMRNAINVLKAIERTRARAFFVKLEII